MGAAAPLPALVPLVGAAPVPAAPAAVAPAAAGPLSAAVPAVLGCGVAAGGNSWDGLSVGRETTGATAELPAVAIVPKAGPGRTDAVSGSRSGGSGCGPPVQPAHVQAIAARRSAIAGKRTALFSHTGDRSCATAIAIPAPTARQSVSCLQPNRQPAQPPAAGLKRAETCTVSAADQSARPCSPRAS